FVDDVVKCHLKRQGVQSYLYTYNDGWDYVEGYSPRVLESVVLEPGEKEHMLQGMIQFRRSKQRYESLCVPYHRGYLLYGPPGTGKTSLVSALAAHFGLSIYIINLADFNDRSLMGAVNNVPANSVLLFEDIDCMLYLGKASDRQKVELYRRFFPESTEAAAWEFVEASGSAETMAEFQGLLLALEVKSFERREESSDRVAASRGTLA